MAMLVDAGEVSEGVVLFLDARTLAHFARGSPQCARLAGGRLRHLHWYIYSVGGQILDWDQPAVERYNVRANCWDTLAPLPVSCDVRVAELQGQIYVFGAVQTERPLVARYDSLRDDWDDLGPPPSVPGYGREGDGMEPLLARQAVVLGSSIYVAGDKHIAQYTPPKAWKLLPPMPGDAARWHNISTGDRDIASRRFFKLVVAGGLLYAVGGEGNYKSQSSHFGLSDKFERYDPRTERWEALAPLPSQRCCSAAACTGTVVAVGPCVVVLETYSENFEHCGRSWAYNAAGAGTWRELPQVPTPRRGACSAVLNDALYVIAGMSEDDDEEVSTVERCRLRGGAGVWEPVSSMRVCRGGDDAVAIGELRSIFVVGGWSADDDEHEAFTIVERFSTYAAEQHLVGFGGWEVCAPCLPRRRCPRLAVVRTIQCPADA